MTDEADEVKEKGYHWLMKVGYREGVREDSNEAKGEDLLTEKLASCYDDDQMR